MQCDAIVLNYNSFSNQLVRTVEWTQQDSPTVQACIRTITTVMGARTHGQRGTCPPPWKCCKVLFVLQMLSKVSVHEVFIHYFEKMSWASLHQGSAPGPHQGTSQTRSLPTPKKSCGRPWLLHCTHKSKLSVVKKSDMSTCLLSVTRPDPTNR